MADRKRKEKPSVSIIGTGRLGTALALGLSARGYALRSLVSRRVESARKAATLVRKSAASAAMSFDSKPAVVAATRIASLPPADLFLISVPDDQIPGVARDLSKLRLDPKP